LPYLLNKTSITKHSNYNPTFFLKHHVLQSIYELSSPQINVKFDRERIYFTDGGHISLDWSNRIKADAGKPIILIMHGMTGGS
jgi:predicted alpha/beta-fold hydrolase